ncbi:MAG: hypothetical protein ABF276_04895, partial [Sulfurovum sp.]
MLKLYIPRFVFIVFMSMMIYSLSHAESSDTKTEKNNDALHLESFVYQGAVLISEKGEKAFDA